MLVLATIATFLLVIRLPGYFDLNKMLYNRGVVDKYERIGNNIGHFVVTAFFILTIWLLYAN